MKSRLIPAKHNAIKLSKFNTDVHFAIELNTINTVMNFGPVVLKDTTHDTKVTHLKLQIGILEA